MITTKDVKLWEQLTNKADDLGFTIKFEYNVFVLSADNLKYTKYTKDNNLFTGSSVEECLAFLQGFSTALFYSEQK